MAMSAPGTFLSNPHALILDFHVRSLWEEVIESNKHDYELVGYLPGGKATLLLYQIPRFG
jgi:hypothetical protein